MQRYQINSSQLFLTYPQCPLSKETVYDYFINLYNPVEIIVAHEHHSNGDDHLHVYIKLKGPVRVNDPKFADLPGGYHGNYQGCRSSKNVIRYCTKADDYLSNIDVSERLSKVSSRKSDMELLINRKRTLEELLVDKPQYLFNYMSLSNSLKCFFEATQTPKETLPKWLPNPWGKLLPILPENKKCRHYHIFSSGPNAGKTTWAKDMVRQYGGTIISNKEPYWNIDEQCKLIFLDEYNSARLRYDELNALADGTYNFRRFNRGTLQFIEGKQPIIFISGNMHLFDIYPHMHNLLYARYKEIDISQFKF